MRSIVIIKTLIIAALMVKFGSLYLTSSYVKLKGKSHLRDVWELLNMAAHLFINEN